MYKFLGLRGPLGWRYTIYLLGRPNRKWIMLCIHDSDICLAW